MHRAIAVSLAILFSFTAFAQNLPAYKIYNTKGKKVSYKKMLKQLRKSEVVLFGELHNNAIAHWLQLEVTKALDETDSLVLGAEMFEADNQEPLNQYLSGEIDAKGLDTLARLWSNYKTDYAPLVNYAKEHNLAFIATNIPRRYAKLVYRKGFSGLDTLSAEEKSWMAPLPMAFDSTLPRYQHMLTMMGDHGTMEVVKAQASKDATMAHLMLQNLVDVAIFLHFNGSYHSDYFEGIVWYLQQSQPNLSISTISTVTQDDIDDLEEEYLGKADFIICVDADVTTTY